ncbi:D-aminoacyl-tRNA deacylase [Holdemania massiliensis]|uniref:D-aminoacyl-tRNA deacylase n=1 Tax=Holdemania massiliensis TaxID=1468449 RepID=UPI001F069A06|nr:D-aminoacyl-tRNA deacylase [Holdemania massiliensis]MCH1942583.1 D-aminoacyl-tRNA deacylase [Holdemania massiliensis]
MRIVLQRVKEASVAIDGQLYNEIEGGYLLLVGITAGDSEEIAEKMAAKVHDLRIFEDENGKMNLAIEQIGGQVLSISQFTLYANCKKGRRPSFDQAARPELASPLYDYFNEALRRQGLVVKPGIFGAEMKVRLLNDGPVTLILDSSELF